MRNEVRLRLQSLSKDQLVKLVEDYKRALDIISEICVDESKSENAHELFQSIRLCLSTYDIYPLNDEYLAAFIDLNMGKMKPAEFRELVLGDNNDEEHNQK